MPCNKVHALTEAEFRRLSGTSKAREKEYDVTTRHGATQGARF